ncbi:MAG TPA: F0F1 ATP synthase subunit A [Terriglobales bacterium]|nr:F0F1 ATP synthase subunit A [Terriglobales bacterium]
METQLWFTHWLNVVLGPSLGAVLGMLGVHPADPRAPFNNTFSMEILVALILAAFGTWLGMRLSVDAPRAWQGLTEVAWNAVEDQGEQVMGHGSGTRFLNFLFTLMLFILAANLIGLIPGFMAPTADASTTLGLALVVFLLYHSVGIRKHGFRYIKQFLGPVWWLAPLMLVIEFFGHLARVLSLSVRLYANMFAGDLIIGVFVALLPITGIVFMGLHLFVALLQTYIFVVLAMVYLAGALAEAH